MSAWRKAAQTASQGSIFSWAIELIFRRRDKFWDQSIRFGGVLDSLIPRPRPGGPFVLQNIRLIGGHLPFGNLNDGSFAQWRASEGSLKIFAFGFDCSATRGPVFF